MLEKRNRERGMNADKIITRWKGERKRESERERVIGRDVLNIDSYSEIDILIDSKLQRVMVDR